MTKTAPFDPPLAALEVAEPSSCALRFGDRANQSIVDMAMDGDGAITIVGNFLGRLDLGGRKYVAREDREPGTFQARCQLQDGRSSRQPTVEA